MLTERLVNARPGDVIDIPEGVFAFDRPLALTVDGLTLRGQGADRTILSFQDQVMGEEGLLVTARNITLENLAIEDPIGDGVSISQSENVVIRGLRVEWTDGPDADNGAYGIAPIGSTNVLVEDSIAIGAAAAGIHVGQSHNVVIRRNRAERNRVGIQIENTTDCDLYENVATGNSGGILVTASPAQPASIGSTRIFDNHVFDNNFESFGRTDTAAARLPTGSGIALQASDQVEIFGNVIADHRSANMIIAALTEAGQPILDVGAGFDPYPETLHVHDNDFRGGGLNPDGLELQVLRLVIAGPLGRMPDILWDGYLDPAKLVDGQMPDSLRICIDNGTADIVDADPQGGRASPRIVTDAHRCTHPPLPAIHLDFATPAGVGTD
ncbi:parallel beta-helix domain-containing protein [Maricaulis sp.]|uniref:parallel beta-helix domain-containing protein n=1 Tax=Maricaulis sp. TaxID=1486257 RepID=UPI002B2649A0|nr:parallel beta-helix domain-containing protein [Maricaulis sp.]